MPRLFLIVLVLFVLFQCCVGFGDVTEQIKSKIQDAAKTVQKANEQYKGKGKRNGARFRDAMPPGPGFPLGDTSEEPALKPPRQRGRNHKKTPEEIERRTQRRKEQQQARAGSKKRKIEFNPVSVNKPFQITHTFTGTAIQSMMNWRFGNDAVITESRARLTPNVPGRHGFLANVNPVLSEHWEIEFDVRIRGTKQFGGDGLGLWLVDAEQTADPFFLGPEAVNNNHPNQNLFGMVDTFKGMGVLIDTYDNDGDRRNPHVIVLSNPTGEARQYDPQGDFENSRHKELPYRDGPVDTKSQHSSCVIDIRNRNRAVRMLVKYLHNILHVYIDLRDGGGFGSCLQVQIDDADFVGNHLIFTAETGGASDQVELLDVTVRYLNEFDDDDEDLESTYADEGKSFNDKEIKIGLFALSVVVFGVAIFQYRSCQSSLDQILLASKLNGLVMPQVILTLLLTVALFFAGYIGIMLVHLFVVGWYALNFFTGHLYFKPPLTMARKGISPLARALITAIIHAVIVLIIFIGMLFGLM